MSQLVRHRLSAGVAQAAARHGSRFLCGEVHGSVSPPIRALMSGRFWPCSPGEPRIQTRGQLLSCGICNATPDDSNVDLKSPAPAVARILSIQEEVPGVKRFMLSAQQQEFSFLPGQWVDLFPPSFAGVDAVGGYSFASSPHQLQADRTFQLLVKHSRHPVAQWMHTRAAAGDEVKVMVGGTFNLSAAQARAPLLFIAGGIGIAPLYSMLSYAWELQANSAERQRVLLLYSARHPSNFAMASDIDALARVAGPEKFQVWDAVTSGNEGIIAAPSQVGSAGVTAAGLLKSSQRRICGRFQAKDIWQAVQWVSSSPAGTTTAQAQPLAFLCGPPEFSDACAKHLEVAGLPTEQIHYERWW